MGDNTLNTQALKRNLVVPSQNDQTWIDKFVKELKEDPPTIIMDWDILQAERVIKKYGDQFDTIDRIICKVWQFFGCNDWFVNKVLSILDKHEISVDPIKYVILNFGQLSYSSF